MVHSRAEVVLLQKAFAQAGPIRHLRHVQDAVLTIPRFLPGEMLLAAAAELELLPSNLRIMSDDTIASLSPEQLDQLLETATFPDGRILAFPQFLNMLSAVKRRYTQSVAGRSSPSSIRQAVLYVVDTMGDWKEEAEEGDDDAAKKKKKKARKSIPAAALPTASPLLNTSQSPADATTPNRPVLEQYLSWFGVRADPKEVTSEAFLQDVHASDVKDDRDDAEVDLSVPPPDGASKPSVATVGHIAVALMRQRRSAAQRKSAPKLTARGSVLNAIHVPVLHAMHPTKVVTSDVAKQAAQQLWLNPEFPEKGSGPRASFFTHDTPPSTTDVAAHQMRVVAASMRSGARNKAALCASSASRDRAEHRSLADLLRLPRLSEASVEHVHDMTDAAIAESAQRRRDNMTCSAHQQHLASFWCTGGPQKDVEDAMRRSKRSLSSTELNYRIDETYRKAQQLGVSTSKATATVERRLAEQRRAERSQRTEAVKASLRSGFVL